MAHVKDQGNLWGISKLFEEFINGIAHDSNMVECVGHFVDNKESITEPDFHKEFNLKHEEETFTSYHQREDNNPWPIDLANPVFPSYKKICLD
jgi:hypothetical protein